MTKQASPPKVSEFYERKRRLAYVFAWLSMTFLLVQLFLGSLLEFTSHPRATVAESGVLLLHRCLTQDEADGSRLLVLDAAMKSRDGSIRLLDTATAVLPEGREITVFYGSRASVMTDRKVTRNFELGQKWDVLAAVRGAWLFGWSDGKILARRRENDAWGPEIEVAKSGLVERLSASTEGTAGPLVAWRERGKNLVKCALFDGAAFVPKPDFDIGAVQHWDAALAANRVLLAVYNRDDRSFQHVTLRLECCAGCPSPVAPRKIAFTDAVLLLGRKVTGLAAAVAGDRLRFFVTRTTTVMTASVPLDTLQPDPAASKLVSINVDPLWRNVAGAVAPTLLFFFSCSLVFIGLTLLRERGRIATEKLDPSAAQDPPLGGILPRAMAYVLDLVLLFPVFLAAAGVMAVSIDDLEDPHYTSLMAVIAGVEMAYHFAMEWAFGWTVGKKIIGLKVTELGGARLTLRGALLRNLFRIIDGHPLGMILGLALMIKTKKRQRLGDVIGRTMVIQDLG